MAKVWLQTTDPKVNSSDQKLAIYPLMKQMNEISTSDQGVYSKYQSLLHDMTTRMGHRKFHFPWPSPHNTKMEFMDDAPDTF